jgi:glycosyltransferase involved in cell wall biosynthesis
MLDGSDSDELEIIVVCNGCTDSTAELARALKGNIKVIETHIASKSNALNLGDSYASGYPRFYIDADVFVPLDAIRETAAVLKKGTVLAAAPKMQVDCENRSWPVRAFYHIWLKLPYCREGMIGSGVYALSRQGRQRFVKFPPITADDGFVRSLFSASERVTVQNSQFTIYPPKNLQGIVNIKTRAYYGYLELYREFPDLHTHEGKNNNQAIIELLRQPRYWMPVLIYFYVRILSRIKALYRFHRGIRDRWERDDTSREIR